MICPGIVLAVVALYLDGPQWIAGIPRAIVPLHIPLSRWQTTGICAQFQEGDLYHAGDFKRVVRRYSLMGDVESMRTFDDPEAIRHMFTKKELFMQRKACFVTVKAARVIDVSYINL